MCKKFGRISQDYGTTTGTDSIRWMVQKKISFVLKDRTVTFARIVCDYRAQKVDPIKVRIMANGNLINYLHEPTTRTADLIITKLLLNSVIGIPCENTYVLTLKTCTSWHQ